MSPQTQKEGENLPKNDQTQDPGKDPDLLGPDLANDDDRVTDQETPAKKLKPLVLEPGHPEKQKLHFLLD